MSDTNEFWDAQNDASADSSASSADHGSDRSAGATTARRRVGGLSGMLLPELQQLAGSLGITGTARMRKSQLIDAIKDKQGGGSADGAERSAAASVQGDRSVATSRLPLDDATAGSGAGQLSSDAAPVTEARSGGEGRGGESRGGEDRGAAEGRTGEGRTGEGRTDNRGQRSNRSGEGRGEGRGERSDRNGERPDRNGERSDRNGENRGGDRDRSGGRDRSGDRDGESRGDRDDSRAADRGGDGNRDRDDDWDNRRGRRGRRYRDRNRRRGRDGEPSEPEVTEDDVLIPVAGILDVLDNYAFVRTSGYLPGPNDVYVSLAQVRRHGLRKGDAVTGAVRQPRDGERREKFNALVRLDTINGTEPDQARSRLEFTKLTPL
ncbi:MAG: Rho termination factor N-terminal domain-containing protein, partial [Sporichthyaceae bacterium]|nr:Rho termination factor N-terminal domain-containing protein [Sporichthyaceae bacterium]